MLKWMKMMRLIKSGSPITSERDARAQSSAVSGADEVVPAKAVTCGAFSRVGAKIDGREPPRTNFRAKCQSREGLT